MSEASIQKSLARDYYGKGMFFKNATFGGFECDFLLITKANITHEIEIKCSKSDFRRDFTHKSTWISKEAAEENELGTAGFRWNTVEVKKHALLQSKCEIGPQKFSFCCPDGLLTVDDIPAKYGLYYAMNMDDGQGYIKEVRSPKRLHKKKITEATTKRLLMSFHANRSYKETFNEYLKSEKDQKQKMVEYKARKYNKITEAFMNCGLTIGTCDECSKPIIRGDKLSNLCWRHKGEI